MNGKITRSPCNRQNHPKTNTHKGGCNYEDNLLDKRFKAWRERFDFGFSIRFSEFLKTGKPMEDDVVFQRWKQQEANAIHNKTGTTRAEAKCRVISGTTPHSKRTKSNAHVVNENNRPDGNSTNSLDPKTRAESIPQTYPRPYPGNRIEKQDKQGEQTIMEKMISEYDMESNKATASKASINVWISDTDLGNFLKTLAGKIRTKYREYLQATKEPVETLFEIYTNNSIISAQAFNSTRKQQREMIQEFIEARFKATKAGLRYDWIAKSRDDVEAVFTENDKCEIAMAKAFGKEWEEFYIDARNNKVDRIYKVVSNFRNYKQRLYQSVRKEICVLEERLPFYHETAFSETETGLKSNDSELATKSLEILSEIQNNLRATNRKLLEAEAQTALKALQYAVNKYCETMENKLESRALDPSKVNEFHNNLALIILDSFYNIPNGFYFTPPWHGERSRIVQMLENEHQEFLRLNEINLKLQAAENEGVVHFYTTQFRRNLMEHFVPTDKYTETEAEDLLNVFLQSTKKSISAKLPLQADSVFTMIQERVNEAIINFKRSFTNQSVIKPSVPIPFPQAPPAVLHLSTKSITQPQPISPPSLALPHPPETPSAQSSVPSQETTGPAPSTFTSGIPPHSSGFGICFTQTEVHVAAFISDRLECFSLPSSILLYEEIPDPLELTYLVEPPSKDPIALETFGFLTRPDCIQTQNPYYYRGNSEPILAEEALAILFESLKSEAKSRWKRDMTSESIVIALSILVDSRCRRRLKSALAIAGLDQSRFVQPATAIYLSYLQSISSPKTGHHALIVSLGYLGMDVAVLHFGEHKVTTKSTGSISFLGRRNEPDEITLARIESVIKYVVQKGNLKKTEEIASFICAESDTNFKNHASQEAFESFHRKLDRILQNAVPKGDGAYGKIYEAMLPGLVWISEKLLMNSCLPLDNTLYHELFPNNVFVHCITKRSAHKSFQIISEGQKCKDIVVKIPASQLQYEESDPSLFALRVQAPSISINYKEMDFFVTGRLLEKAPNAEIIISVSKEGIIDSTIDFKCDLTEELCRMEWKRPTVTIPTCPSWNWT